MDQDKDNGQKETIGTEQHKITTESPLGCNLLP